MPIAVVPCLLVSIVTAGRNQLVEDRGKILLQARLELDCADCRRAADIENIRGARLDSRGSHDGRDLIRKVVHVTVTFCGDRDLTLIAHERPEETRRSKPELKTEAHLVVETRAI